MLARGGLHTQGVVVCGLKASSPESRANGTVQGNCQVARARVRRGSYETEDDIIFGSSANRQQEGVDVSLRPLFKGVESIPDRYPDVHAIQGTDFFADIEEWVDFGVRQEQDDLTEELSTTTKKGLVVMCIRRGLNTGGDRHTLIQRLVDYEMSHPDSTISTEHIDISSILKSI